MVGGLNFVVLCFCLFFFFVLFKLFANLSFQKWVTSSFVPNIKICKVYLCNGCRLLFFGSSP